MKHLSNSERNLQNLQATIDSLVDDITRLNAEKKKQGITARGLVTRARLYESLARLIYAQEKMSSQIYMNQSVVLDRVARFLLNKGSCTRQVLRQGQPVAGGVKVLDQALDLLEQIGFIEVTKSKPGNKNHIVYTVVEPTEDPVAAVALNNGFDPELQADIQETKQALDELRA